MKAVVRSQRQPIWHHQHGKGKVLLFLFLKLGTILQTERKPYSHSCSSPQSTHDASYNILGLMQLPCWCCKLLCTNNITPEKPRMTTLVMKIKGDETASRLNHLMLHAILPRKSTTVQLVMWKWLVIELVVSTTVLVDLFEELMTAVHGLHFVWRASWSFWESEQMFEMIRFALVVLVLFVSEKINAVVFYGLVVITWHRCAFKKTNKVQLENLEV